MKSEPGLSWIRTLWPFGVGVFGWFTGILGAVCGWLARNFLGKSILEFVRVRQEIQKELTYLSNVDLPSSRTFREGTAEDYEEEVRIFAEARGKVRRLGAKLSALNTSFYRPLSYLLRILGYKIDDAAKNLLRLSAEFEDDDRALSLYQIEVALRLHHSDEKLAKSIIEHRERRLGRGCTKSQDRDRSIIMKSEPGPPMTLGAAAAAQVRLIVWCKSCQHQVEPDPAEMAARYGADTSVLDWREKLVCSQCGGRQADMVVTGDEATIGQWPLLGPSFG